MLKKFARMLVALLFAGATAAFAAQNYGTKDEAIAMAERVAAQYKAEGLEPTIAAVMDKENAEYHDGDLYAFIIGHEGVMVAHGANEKLVGRNLIGIKDPSGRLFMADMINVSKSGTPGWVPYDWTNPRTQKVAAKEAYILPLGDGLLAAVGVYVD